MNKEVFKNDTNFYSGDYAAYVSRIRCVRHCNRWSNVYDNICRRNSVHSIYSIIDTLYIKEKEE